MKTVAVDFDGVIHAYSKGWADGSIYDGPLPGALEALRDLMAQVPVFIFTSRCKEQVAEWLQGRGFAVTADDSPFEHKPEWDGTFWDTRGVLLVTNKKLAAEIYIDDRALRFRNWHQALNDLYRFTGISTFTQDALPGMEDL